MPTKMPLPTRKSDKTLYFSDYPEFKPNLTPEEIFRMGSFGGTYYRPIYSTINNRKYTGAHKEFEKHGLTGTLIAKKIREEIDKN